MKEQNLVELIRSLPAQWVPKEWRERTDEELLAECLPLVKGTRIMNAIEFGRAVHAEMAAITEAAARGVSIRDATLFTTTFPCHNCARHIISAGIRRVLYIEPYAKSLAQAFHGQEIVVDPAEPASDADDGSGTDCGPVRFEPFVGVAPRIYMSLFTMIERKKNGRVIEWVGATAVPRADLVPQHISYFKKEFDQAERLQEVLADPPANA